MRQGAVREVNDYTAAHVATSASRAVARQSHSSEADYNPTENRGGNPEKPSENQFGLYASLLGADLESSDRHLFRRPAKRLNHLKVRVPS